MAVCTPVHAQQPANRQPAPGRVRTQVAVPQAAAARQAGAVASRGAQPEQALPAASPREGPPQVNAPFQLTPQQQLELDRMLTEWEQRSQQVTVFRCEVTRHEYDGVFNKETIAVGELKYMAPDRGLYRVSDQKTGEPIEDWRCDGKSIYEFNYEKKQLIERTLPKELQGKAIANGPLPFIFGAKAATLKKRYFLRLKQPPQGYEKMIAIEAYPRYQTDAANFLKADLLLHQDSLLPFALNLHLPNGKSTTAHIFDKIETNDLVGKLLGDFSAPSTPFGWKRLVDPESAPPQDDPNHVTTVPTPAGEPKQAAQPTATERR